MHADHYVTAETRPMIFLKFCKVIEERFNLNIYENQLNIINFVESTAYQSYSILLFIKLMEFST